MTTAHEHEIDQVVARILSLREEGRDETRDTIARARAMNEAARLATIVVEAQLLDMEQLWGPPEPGGALGGAPT